MKSKKKRGTHLIVYRYDNIAMDLETAVERQVAAGNVWGQPFGALGETRRGGLLIITSRVPDGATGVDTVGKGPDPCGALRGLGAKITPEWERGDRRRHP